MAFSFVNSNTTISAGATSWAITKPTNTADGDIMFLLSSVCDVYPDSHTGWTSIAQSNDGYLWYEVFYKIASSEGSSYTITTASSVRGRMTIATYRDGFNASNPIDVVSNTQYLDSNKTLRAASMTVTNSGSALVFLGSGLRNGALNYNDVNTGPGTFTNNVDTGAGSTAQVGQTIQSLIWGSSGATGNMDAVMGSTLNIANKHAFAVALNIKTAPTVTTQAVSSITTTTATGNGNVTADGGATVSERGVCWKTSTGPTTADSKANSGTGTGAYTVSMTSLSPNTLYYAKAYAINSVGTSYGSEVTFTTLSSGPANLKTYNTNAKANIKSINTNLIANVKTLNTNA